MRTPEQLFLDSPEIGPITVGDLLPIWTITLTKADNVAFDLTGATFAGRLFDVETGNAVTLTGSFAITSTTNGIFTFTPLAADVSIPGRYILEITVTQSSKPFRVHFQITIEPALG